MISLFISLFLFIYGDISQLRRADELYKNGKYEDALTIYQQQLNEDPGNFNIAFNIGNTLLKLGRFEDSKKAFERANSLAKMANLAADSYYNKSISSVKSEDIESAMKDLRTAIRLNPNDKDARANYEIISRLLDKKKQEQKQDQKKDQNKDDKNKKENQKDDKSDNQKKEDQKKQQQEQQKNEQNKQEQEKKQQQPQEAKISPEQAQRLLDAMKKNEKEQLLKKNDFMKRNDRRKAEKDW